MASRGGPQGGGNEHIGEMAEWSTKLPKAVLDAKAKRERPQGEGRSPESTRSPAKGVRANTPSRVRSEARSADRRTKCAAKR